MSPKSEFVRIERIEGMVMPVNSYIVEGPDGLVIVDGQLTVSDATKVRDAAAKFDRPIVALVLTHGHPDHYAGAATILEGTSAPILATAGVADVIIRDDEEKDAIVAPMMGGEWPTKRRFPDELVEPGSSIALGGLTFDVRDLGPGESDDDTVWSIHGPEKALVFSGDIAYHDMHAYLLDGHFEAWLALLARFEAEIDADATLFVGHGKPTDKSVLRHQATYVNRFVEAVSGGLELTEGERHDRVLDAMGGLVTDQRLRFLMELSIEPVAAVLRTRADGRAGSAVPLRTD